MGLNSSFGEVNLDALDATIADTAADIFVYDTSKDSDGGKWRKRIKKTSWYNETLNTATRGSRREFPAVAVIVAESQKIRIYDGDDPDLPMWMVFEINQYPSGSNLGRTPIGIGHVSALPYNLVSLSSVRMLNGLLFIGGNRDTNAASVCAAYDINFISEVMHEYLHYPVNAIRTSKWKLYGNVSQRNSTDVVQFPSSRYKSSGTDGGFLHVVNDVAMTVLPNAPVDDTTGLPIPTIALATDRGTSVIKDDGTVVDMTRLGYHTDFVEFIEYNGIKLLCYLDIVNEVEIYSPGVFEIPNSDVDFGNVVLQRFTRDQAPIALGALNGVPTSVSNSNIDKGNSSGLTRIYLQGSDNNSKDQSSAAYITSDYNTGWMHGDIKGAFLSDTDTTNVSAVVVNSSAGDWSQQGTINWTITSATEITVSSVASGQSAGLRLTTDSSKHYVYSFNITSVSDNVTFRNDQNKEIEDPNPNSTGVYTGNFTGTSYVEFRVYQNDSATITSIDIREAEEDRSINNKGLAVYGTVTKSAVATGADLVAYSGFSYFNYFERPNYSALSSIGTGDFSVIWWGNGIKKYETIMSYGSSTNSGNLIIQTGDNQSGSNFRVFVNGANNTSSVGTATYDSGWTLYSVMRRNNTVYFYHNLKLIDTIAIAGQIGNSNHTLRIGDAGNAHSAAGIGHDAMDFGSMSLLRISGSAPSSEQIKKMYEDEKCLFHENAKCTLYGSSDAVTALAYDDKTNLLHVGTSSGRSDFRKLRRINNTTTGITTAISASKGLIAEQ